MVLLVATVIGGCGGDPSGGAARPAGGEPAGSDPAGSDAEAGPAPLGQVGSAADLWAFPFTMAAARDQVRDALGEPISSESRRDDARTGGPEALTWEYPGLIVTFLTGTSDGDDYLISVRVTDPSVALGSGIAVGMPVDDAVTILGNPQVRDDRSLVYFYRASTIEIVVDAGRVASVVLARALP
ncbi:MAG: hypothetical protein EA382_18575 [Spirochaetaceae bacterium]|nr:MAG: hypothetical protein EA382_18575 [Spirochaetaceae bacterium]